MFGYLSDDSYNNDPAVLEGDRRRKEKFDKLPLSRKLAKTAQSCAWSLYCTGATVHELFDPEIVEGGLFKLAVRWRSTGGGKVAEIVLDADLNVIWATSKEEFWRAVDESELTAAISAVLEAGRSLSKERLVALLTEALEQEENRKLQNVSPSLVISSSPPPHVPRSDRSRVPSSHFPPQHFCLRLPFEPAPIVPTLRRHWSQS